MTNEQIKKILLSGGYITEKNINEAEEYAEKNKASMTEYLVREELVSEDILGQAIAEYFGLVYADLNSFKPDFNQIKKIPEEIAKKFRIVLFKENDKKAIVTTDFLEDKGRKGEFSKVIKSFFPTKKVILAYSLPENIEDIFLAYRKNLETRFEKIIQEKGRVAPQIFDEIISDALVLNASDIHIEPRESDVLVRFRIDGVLQEAGKIPKNFYENILNRIKVQARLRTDEHFSAQDGAIRYEKENNSVDIRVSIVPIVDGEKVVMRILSKYVKGLTLSSLGFLKVDEEKLIKTSKKPFGMILVVGPTGSGKTTTLYSLIRILNNSKVNIATIEDPVEYRIKGINQIQVNIETNLNFVKGLRSIVRQDPDIILVGEIRDSETVEIAVNAALTGHLMLSTFHANDAATAIPRLLDMKVEPFLLASTLELIIAQRLVRRICESCRYSYIEKGKTFYKGKGCDVCNHTGYKGRIAIFEFIQITAEMKELILKNPSSNEIWKIAKKQGSHTLYEDGLEKVKSGITTMEELNRIASSK